MAEIKLVASDLDGTLLTSKKELTERLLEALQKIHEMGIFFVPSTGRAFSALPQCVKELPSLRYVITGNGASVYDAVEQKDLFRNLLSPEAIDVVISLVKGLPVIPEYSVGGQAHIPQEIFNDLTPYGLTESHTGYIRTTRTPVADFWGELERQKENLENINLIFTDLVLRQRVWDELKALGLASVTSYSDKNIEITGLTATKSHALAQLCEVLGITAENILAMGDSDNDLDMLQFAGIGVAMENGQSHIKEAADFITAGCDAFGAAIVLEKLIEKGDLP